MALKKQYLLVVRSKCWNRVLPEGGDGPRASRCRRSGDRDVRIGVPTVLKRPRGCRAAEQRDELAAPHLRGHSMTSSARASSEGGTVSPSNPGGLAR